MNKTMNKGAAKKTAERVKPAFERATLGKARNFAVTTDAEDAAWEEARLTYLENGGS